MNYQEALAYINDKEKYGSRLGLHSIGRLMELLGNPQDNLRYIHVAGTNGKGSTSSYLAHCLKSAGYKVGLYTSPYLERFNERIQINGEDIPNEKLASITKLVKEKANIMVEEGMLHPTTFEIITAISFVFFNLEKVDYVVLEVGLGGRFDSTNIISSSLASVITTLDYDHIDVLGNTLGEIAYQKAGIIKENGIVVSYPQEQEALEVIKKVAKEMNSEFYLDPIENIKIKEETEFGSIFDFKYKDQHLKNIKISLLGHYQVYNASLAIVTLLILREKKLVNITDEEIFEGIALTEWKGRLEVLRRNPTFLIDGAHNIQGITHLANALKLFKYNKLILGISILKDKDYKKMIELLGPLADKVVATEVKMPRKLDAEILADYFKGYVSEVYVEKEIKDAVAKTIELADKDDLIVFGGSLYMIGEVRTIVNLL
ncbi:folylpolyglutamate synthase/dihydrofolate synthase family protein [Tissierella sp. Yu-01]|uniref:bifunctional folylpolyglutamate synthase/dihydrofolate synthase n=1 Tax=Tissierella sp. Yu-01 TaxID=3035694 RepID=UPI00240E59F5|nr:folylpolyglutamate synthase/dihydrofolate synthase family protein [Tissierella sp. Yu-01]WFA09903.1 bifunctional folylpolyglutamate synthase/dihydrofolate synthase [Tissierella sp. Yu-01]